MKRIYIWGTGTVADQIIQECNVFEQYKVLGFIDNNIHKVGKRYKNNIVYSPDILNRDIPDKVVVLSNFYEEIRTQIVEDFPHIKNLIENKYFFYKEILLKRYEDSYDSEIKKTTEFIKINNLDVFNYDFKIKYDDLNIEIFFDDRYGMFYVYHNSKRMYFSKHYNTKEKVKAYYSYLLLEQDMESPHRYLTAQFNIKEGDIVIDAGAAEGNFALEIIEKASKIYLIETDEEWIEALQVTFKDYQDKIIIIKKYLTSINAGKYATLDSLITEPVNFVKMDIEGNERDALEGAKRLFECSDDLKCAICVYHQDFDEILVKDIMETYGMDCSTTPGYMWFPFGERQKYTSTRLCRGIVRGVKN